MVKVTAGQLEIVRERGLGNQGGFDGYALFFKKVGGRWRQM
jgi:hypothetical protein